MHDQQPKAPRYTVTPAFLAEQDAKHAAYMEQRRRWMAHFVPRDLDQDTQAAEPSKPLSLNLATQSRSRRKSSDPRQLSFEV